MIPGEYFLASEPITANVGRATATVFVTNTGDRPVQVGSHFHFFEVNKHMAFERSLAFGMRLNIPAGTAVRFEPGEEKEVELVAFGGQHILHGFSNLAGGETTSAEAREAAVAKANAAHFKNTTS
ncbi:urease subunit beta/urease subunit gamma/beta [Cnuella takakiae]|uniref:Urease subunit beta n=1 Tax=Cnuella takakiae TaxID=1302690 RepID=A0A1M4V8M3_9BACT|nr:urease subunit beta [Cnuella takakiae]OLY92676.1 urease subunit beta [Cnuella takakiae]SHE65223.1 urease subunit beta/urease subunit gamma/beta [Cnuella takakiae]